MTKREGEEDAMRHHSVNEQLYEIKKRHDKHKGPFGFCGLRTTLDCINEYTEFCGVYMPKLIEALNVAMEALGKLSWEGSSVNFPVRTAINEIDTIMGIKKPQQEQP